MTGKYNEKDEANALIFIRRHLPDALKTQYLQVRKPSDLWKRLKERYDHTKTVMLPQAQYDWQHLRLQDFKSVSEYNSALFDIVSRLELCGVKLEENELLEKTFSTFHVSNILLQQQYRQRQFKTYSELISVLLTAEQTNQLLLKNHDLRPAGSKAIPEVNATERRNTSRFRGRGQRSRNGSQRGSGRPTQQINKPQHRNAYAPNQNKGKKPMQKHDNDNTCNRCGLTGHWSRTCRTQKHFVELYQASIKGKGKRVESHSVEDIETNNALVLHTDSTNEVPLAPAEAKPLEISDFLEDNPAPNPEWWQNAQT